MIIVKNKFQENNLKIAFSGEGIDDKSIDLQVSDDINFKPVVDYLIELIPQKEKLDPNFDDFDNEDNYDKLNLIKETIEEIYTEYNQSIDNGQNVDE